MNEVLTLLDILRLELERKDKYAQSLAMFAHSASPVIREATATKQAQEHGEVVNLEPLFRALEEFMPVHGEIEEIRRQLQEEKLMYKEAIRSRLNRLA